MKGEITSKEMPMSVFDNVVKQVDNAASLLGVDRALVEIIKMPTTQRDRETTDSDG